MAERYGWVRVLCGPMFAGKTEEMLRLLARAGFAGRRALVVHPALDSRAGAEHIESRLGRAMPSRPVSKPADILVLTDQLDPDIVAIEEAQFFDHSIVAVVGQLADDGREVIATGLDRNFRNQTFGPMGELLAHADEVIKLTAVCVRCHGEATRSQRLIDGDPAPADSPDILLGGLHDELYEARCRRCHHVPGLSDWKARQSQ